MSTWVSTQRPELLAAVVDGLAHPVAVFEAGPAPLLAVGNPAFHELAQVAHAAATPLVERIAERAAALAPGGSARYREIVPAEPAPMELDCHLTHDTERGAWVWWATDVSSALRARAARDEAAQEAERREVELTRSNEDLERFASIASHDLSEPLRMVASFADLLARRYRGHLDEQADSYIAYILDGASRMRAMIDALLAFAELRASEHRREPVALEELVQEILGDLRVAIAEADAEIIVGELPVVQADRPALRQVLQNLFGNAIKFRGTEPPRIDVRAESLPGEWLVTVSDNGIGIPEDDRERVFDMFGRLHPRTAYPGSGMGLAMSRRAVELHGGRIWADAAPGGGTVFRFTLPIESSDP